MPDMLYCVYTTQFVMFMYVEWVHAFRGICTSK